MNPRPAQVRRIDRRFALSKREANKVDKLERIKMAARELFTKHSYDDTTTRQIAAKARVALGTLFTYATNKRDLLFLIGNDLMHDTANLAAASFRPNRSLQENFLVLSAVHYRALEAQPELSRLLIREMLFFDSGVHAVRASENRARLLQTIVNLVRHAHYTGEIELPADAEFIAWVLFSVLQACIRRWLASTSPNLTDGLADLWPAIALVINGFSKQPVAMKPTKAEIRNVMERLQGSGSRTSTTS
jgi:AcrR family transcriptional regulator